MSAAPIVLIGPPGAGKTTIGRALARRLGAEFADTDELVEAGAGQTVAEIFTRQGEAAFRRWEGRVVLQALARARAGPGRWVVALGGGAPEAPEAAEALRAGPALVVFLDVSPQLAARRVGLGAPRPLLAAAPRKVWRELMARRRPTYEALAHFQLGVDGLDAAAAARLIARRAAEEEREA
ncbi:MAG: AAA family ATPase [Bifidobacteriaceae bacterium]|nr:AAA family ATPase [Bifidobacteriaceae bacterium]